MADAILPAEEGRSADISYNYRLLDLCLRFGTKMLASGAETSRVEDSVIRILGAYGKKSCSAFAIPTLLLITFQDEDESIFTSSRRIVNRGTDFHRLDSLNSLSRALCTGERKSLDFFSSHLEDIVAIDNYSRPVLLIAAVFVAMGFAYVFGSNIQDILIAGGVACGMKLIYELLNDAKLNSTYIILMSSFLAGFSIETMANWNWIQNPSIVTVSVVMNLVPGMLLTTSIYDIVNKDFTSGLNKLVESTFIALALAIGTGIAVILVR